MPTELAKTDVESVVASIQKFFREELELEELSDMRARHLLDYILKEIAPFAYNQGVQDAESYFRNKVEDLGAICYEDALTYWVKRKR